MHMPPTNMVRWLHVLLSVVAAISGAQLSGQAPTVSTVEDLAAQLQDMSVRFQDVLKSNKDLQATVVYQASRLQQLQRVVETMPRILQERQQFRNRVESLEERVAEIPMNIPETCAEICDGDSTRSGNEISDWFSKVDPKDIAALRNQFKTDQKAVEEIDEDNNDISDTAIKTLSKALARLALSDQHNSGSVVESGNSPSLGPKATKLIAKNNRYNKGKQTKIKDVLMDEAPTQHEIEEEMEHMLRSATQSSKKMVFSVAMTHPLLGHADDPQTVIFDEVKIERGKGYNVKKGVFKCRIAGLYYFALTVRSYEHKHMGVALMLNDQAVVTMATDTAKRQVMQSQSIIIKLVKNDEVWVMMGPSEDYAIFGRKDHTYNVLNGVLLFPEKA